MGLVRLDAILFTWIVYLSHPDMPVESARRQTNGSVIDLAGHRRLHKTRKMLQR